MLQCPTHPEPRITRAPAGTDVLAHCPVPVLAEVGDPHDTERTDEAGRERSPRHLPPAVGLLERKPEAGPPIRVAEIAAAGVACHRGTNLFDAALQRELRDAQVRIVKRRCERVQRALGLKPDAGRRETFLRRG